MRKRKVFPLYICGMNILLDYESEYSFHSNNHYSLPMGAFDNDFRPSSDARHGPEETVGVYQLEPVH